MNIAKKIQTIFEASTGLQLVYGTEEAINRAIGSAQLPCGLLKLMGTSNITTDGGMLTEEPRLSVAVVNLTQFDIDSYDNEDIIADCKAKLENFLLALMASRDLTLEAVTEVSRLYDHYDDIVTGIYATFRLREVVGVACPDGSAPVREIKITDNGTYNVEPYAVAIVDVQGSTPAVVEPLEVEPSNEVQTFNPPPGVDGYAPVTVGACPACPVPDVRPLSVVPSRTAQTFSPMGFDGFAPVEVQGYTPVLQSKTAEPATTAQVVTADGGYDGLSSVNVDAVTAAIDANITPANIKKDVEILGVVGTMEDYEAQYLAWNKAFFSALNVNQANSYIFPSDIIGEIEDIFGVATVGTGAFVFQGCVFEKITMPNLLTIRGRTFQNATALKEVVTPSCSTVIALAFASVTTLERLTFGTLTQLDATFLNQNQPNLRKFEVGQGTNCAIAISRWTATDVIAEGQSGIDELNYNIKTYLADRVADRTGDSALTVTFGASLYNVLTAETIAAFTAKNWNVASA